MRQSVCLDSFEVFSYSERNIRGMIYVMDKGELASHQRQQICLGNSPPAFHSLPV